MLVTVFVYVCFLNSLFPFFIFLFLFVKVFGSFCLVVALPFATIILFICLLDVFVYYLTVFILAHIMQKVNTFYAYIFLKVK